ncbi:cytochrome c peroxidase, mitochondrial [[Candida] anglica]|uniref:Peroxidase n=1 Tax=[Candida] anglica TaxID=148631 RepID=A0ABP0EL49_9ASCO
MSAIRVAPVFRAKPSFKVLAGLVGSSAAALYLLNNYNNNHNGGGHGRHVGKSLLAGSALIVNKADPPKNADFETYQKIYNDIAERMRNDDDADEGAGRYGLLCRLAWHTSGTYKKSDNTGGSFGGTMNYSPESSDGANAGLEYGRAFLLAIREKYPWISHGDLWTLGGVVAVQEAGGPKIKWRPGRKDSTDASRVPENGRLPDAAQGAEHVKNVFGRMGFTDRETVALIGAHCLGKCHTDRSGFDGPWGPSFTMFTNDFFVRLLQGWHVRKWDGPKQYQDDESNSFMMLPTDMALKEDSAFLKYVKIYAADQDVFFKDFSNAFSALLERGIDFPKNSKQFTFKTLDEQEE